MKLPTRHYKSQNLLASPGQQAATIAENNAFRLMLLFTVRGIKSLINRSSAGIIVKSNISYPFKANCNIEATHCPQPRQRQKTFQEPGFGCSTIYYRHPLNQLKLSCDQQLGVHFRLHGLMAKYLPLSNFDTAPSCPLRSAYP
ncbi:hypothetical protein CEXT_142511 [Caerostris extrusa]|uniref:Uncharacterized protein n=1 Tax=Caerostris extrusa TaxID=172846 RepID=A0AAV4ULC9_CAEEX|nr:hypothetical protein CEXT_142511 [Caerostris extrusa]